MGKKEVEATSKAKRTLLQEKQCKHLVFFQSTSVFSLFALAVCGSLPFALSRPSRIRVTQQCKTSDITSRHVNININISQRETPQALYTSCSGVGLRAEFEIPDWII